VLSLGNNITPLFPVAREGPAIAGDLNNNFRILNQDAQAIIKQLTACPSRKFGGGELLSFVKRMYLGRSAASIGRPVGGGGIPVVRAHLKPASQRGAVRLRCDRKQQFPAPPVHAARRSYR
jgi:hypothetical protein